MKTIMTILIMLGLITGCSSTSTSEREQSILDGISINWSTKLEYYGKFYAIVVNGIDVNKDESYYQGLSEGVKIFFQTSSLYDQSETIMLKNLSNYLSKEEISSIETILYNLDESTYMLSQIIKYEKFRNKIPIELISMFEGELNVNNVSTSESNLYNLSRNPSEVYKRNSNTIDLIDTLEEHSKRLYQDLSILYENIESLMIIE